MTWEKNTDQAKRLSLEFEGKPHTELLRYALQEFHPKIKLASSFGAEDVVLIDAMHKINPEFKVFTLDTGRLPQETYDLMDVVRDKYGIKIEVYFPEKFAVETMVREHGFNLFRDSVEMRKLCCNIRKVEPLRRALSGADAWVTGLRREQSQNRAGVEKVEYDNQNGVFKINPIAEWTNKDVWGYLLKNDVPYNKLHTLGYPSIGCLSCTRAVAPGEDERAGRWWWELGSKECGIHREEHK